MTTDEDKISSLYQQKKNEGPPAQLDSAILKAAHQAVDKPNAAKSPFSGGWPAAASIAAVLIITVILVPLIKQEAVSPSTKSIVEKKLETLNEQDAIGRNNAEDMNIKMQREATIKAKKQSLAKEQTRRLAQPLPSREKSSEITQDQAFAFEEAMAPMATKSISPLRSEKMATTITGENNLNDDETRTEAELQQQSSPMLAADETPAITLTPKLWLKKIQQLIEQGNLNLAQEELDKFKKQYPDEEIDPSILNSLKDRP